MTKLAAAKLDFTSHSPAETRSFGRLLGRLLQPGDVVLLEGEFGAGKTVLVQGIARGLEADEAVISPSFTLVNEYRAGESRGGMPIYHADLYRIMSQEEALALGLDEYMSGRGVFVVEWPENAVALWPEERLWITLRVAGVKERLIHVDAQGQRYISILKRMRKPLGLSAEDGTKDDSGN